MHLRPSLLLYVLGGLLLLPQPALAAGQAISPQWLGAGVALGFLLVLGAAVAWILSPSSEPPSEVAPAAPEPLPPPSAPRPAPPPQRTRLQRLKQGIAQRRKALQAGGEGFCGDALVMGRYLDACGRLERREPPPREPSRLVPPGTLARLARLYEQLRGATPARARDWPLQRANVAAPVRSALGLRLSSRCLELLDSLAKRRAQKEQVTEDEEREWHEFLEQFSEDEAKEGALSSTPPPREPTRATSTSEAPELPSVDQDVPTVESLPADLEDAPTLDTETLFEPEPREDAPTVDTLDLFGVGPHPSVEDAPPALEEDAPTVDTTDLFTPLPAPEEDAPTVDTTDLFTPAPKSGVSAPEEDAPTVDTNQLFRRKSEAQLQAESEDDPTVDTLKLFEGEASADAERGKRPKPLSGRRKLRERPARAAFTETDELIDPVDDAPTRDTADLFRNE